MKVRYQVVGIVVSLLSIGVVAGCGTQAVELHPSQSTTSQHSTAILNSSTQMSNNTTESGVSRIKVPSVPSAAPKEITELQFINSKKGFAGADGFILRSTDGGIHWTAVFHSQYRVNDIDMVNTEVGYAVTTGQQPDQQGMLFKTTDGGLHWNTVNPLPTFWSRYALVGNGPIVHFWSPTQGYLDGLMHAFGASNQSRPAWSITLDGGKSWNPLYLPKHLVSADWPSSKLGFALVSTGSSYSILRTTDEGASWKSTFEQKWKYPIGTGVVQAVNAHDVWVTVYGGVGMNQQSYTVYQTTNGGQSWKAVIRHATAGAGPAPGFATQTPGGFEGPGSEAGPLAVLPNGTAYQVGLCTACGMGKVSLAATTDGGAHWDTLPFNVDGNIVQVSFPNAEIGWMATNLGMQNSKTNLYHTTNGGIHWTLVNTFG